MKQHKKYRIFSGLLSALVAAFACGTTQVSAAPDVVKLYVAPASLSVVSGNSLTIQVRLSKAANAKVDYAKADLTFSSNQLEITSVSKSGSHFNASGGPVTSFNNSKGTVNISGSGSTLPVNADVLVASVTLRAKSTGTGLISFTNASVVGDLLGSGSMKNALTATAGSSVAVSSPPAPSPPATTQSKPTSPMPSQTTTSPAPTPEAAAGNAEATPNTGPDEQTELISDVKSTDVATDSSQTQGQATQLWQWILSGVISLAAIGGIGYVLIMKKRGQADMLPDSTPAPLSFDAQTETAVAVDAVVQPPAIDSEGLQAEQLASPGPVYSPVENPVSAETASVGGMEIEPLDPAWPTQITPDVQPQVPAVEPVYAPQTTVVETQTPVELVAQATSQAVEGPAPEQQAPVPLTGGDEFPDMFEEGAARLSAEGFDERLKPKNAA